MISFFCLFVWSLSSHSRAFHSFGDFTVNGEGRQILPYAWKSYPLWSGVSVYNGHLRRLRHSHLLPKEMYWLGWNRVDWLWICIFSQYLLFVCISWPSENFYFIEIITSFVLFDIIHISHRFEGDILKYQPFGDTKAPGSVSSKGERLSYDRRQYRPMSKKMGELI